MAEITLTGTYKLELLAEELFAVMPHWVYEGPQGPQTDVKIYGDLKAVTVVAPLTDERKVREIARAHDPENESTGARIERLRVAARARATTKLKGLGLTDEEARAL